MFENMAGFKSKFCSCSIISDFEIKNDDVIIFEIHILVTKCQENPKEAFVVNSIHLILCIHISKVASNDLVASIFFSVMIDDASLACFLLCSML